jgi:hypothetical protein
MRLDAAFISAQNPPDSVLQFLLPSRYCPSDQESLSLLANQVSSGVLILTKKGALRSLAFKSVYYLALAFGG